MDRPIAEIKDRLRQALSFFNMTAQELSEKTQIPKSSISQYLSGFAKPKGDRIHLICTALKISEAWLLGYNVPMFKEKLENDDRTTLCLIFDRLGYKLRPFTIDGTYMLHHKKESDFFVVMSEYELNTILLEISDYIGDLISERFETMIESVKKTTLPNAAHTRTDISITDADIAHDEDIMDDDKF